MAEVINLATFNLDTQKIQSSLDALQDRYFELRKEQKAYVDQSKEVSKQISVLEKSQKALTEAAGDNSEAVAKNDAELNALLKTQKDLYKSEQNLGIQMSSVRKEITLTTTQVKAYQDAEGKTRSLIDQGTAALEREIKTKNDARAANAALNAVSNQLNPNIAEEAELLKKVNAQIDSNTKFIKANASETTQQAMNIGNYKSALDGVDAALLKFGIDGQQARAVFSGFTSAVNKGSQDISSLAGATAKTNLSLKAFSIALASTGIGLVIVGLTALVSYAKTLDPLMDKLGQTTAALSASFRILGQAVSTLSFDGLGSSMANAAKEAAKLKAAQQELQDLQESQEVTNARASQQYDELILKSRNRTLTEEERISFLKKAEKIENDNFKQRSVIVATERAQAIEAAKIAGSLSDEQVKKLEEKGLAYANYLRNSGIITDAEVDNLKKAELAKIAIDAENTRRLEKNQNAQDKLAEDATKKREKEIQDEQSAAQKRKDIVDKNTELLLNKSKEEIDLFIAQQGFKKKSREEELAFNNSLAEKELKDLELQYQKGKISKTKYETDKLNITNEAARKNTSIVIENAQLELEAELEKNQRILESQGFLSKEQLRIKQEALDSELAAEKEFQGLLLENGAINQQEYNSEIDRINSENKKANKDLALAEQAASQEQSLIDLANKATIEENNFIAKAALEKDRNKILMAQELQAAEKNGADISLIKDKYAKLENDIDFTVVQNKLALISGAFGNISQILGENSKVGKAVGIAQALINTYQGITAELATKTITPFEIGLKIANIATVAKIGFDSVRKITAVKTQTTTTSSEPTFKKPNYATGVIGLRGAGDGTSDNISANLSAGESIINARSTSMFANELSAINQAGGGNGINGSSNILNQNNIDQSASNSQMITAIANAVAIGAEAGTSKGSQDGLRSLITDRKVMSDAKF